MMAQGRVRRLLGTATTSLAPPLAFFALLVTAWHLAVTWSGVPPYLLPGPVRVADVITSSLPKLFGAVAVTATGALAGFLLSCAFGIAVALLFSQSRIIERSLFPYAIFLQTVPIVAIAPLVILWIGYGLQGVVAVSFIISLFPIIANTTTGLTSIRPDLLDLFLLNNASRWQTLFKLRLPHAVPNILTGAKVSSGLSVIGAIVGEFFAGFGTADRGLGYLILFADGQAKTDLLFASILFSTLLGLGIFTAVGTLNTILLKRWGDIRP
jgi:NitT/TauT family transport system permease protein